MQPPSISIVAARETRESDRMASRGRPYRTFSIEGFEVLVGRGEDDNDVLTLEIAEPHDLWMHVGGERPGSHVVVRNPTKIVIPRTVIEGAAQLAAWFSKARASASVAVDYCSASDVSKPRGAKPGLVEIRRFKTIKVRPSNPSNDAHD
jgi:predicted ribosome quality control (RQC) complex YloA/Tae2 family protein